MKASGIRGISVNILQVVVVFLSAVGCAFASFAAEPAKSLDYSSVRGFNFQPPWGSNGRDIWLEKFDPVEYRRIIRLAKKVFPQFNTIRVWLSFDAWYDNRKLAVDHMVLAAKIVADEGLKMIPVYFNGWHSIPDFGGITFEQLEVASRNGWEPFGRYLRETAAALEPTGAVLMSDLCNEPMNLVNFANKTEEGACRILDFLKAMAGQCRKVSDAPVLVSTTGFWFDRLMCGKNNDLDLFAETVDVFGIHPYAFWGTPQVKAGHLGSVRRLIAKANELHRSILVTECCWDADGDKARGELAAFELDNYRQAGIGFLVHALSPSPVADLHPKDGINPGFYMPFMNLDGTIRPFHECFNEK